MKKKKNIKTITLTDVYTDLTFSMPHRGLYRGVGDHDRVFDSVRSGEFVGDRVETE